MHRRILIISYLLGEIPAGSRSGDPLMFRTARLLRNTNVTIFAWVVSAKSQERPPNPYMGSAWSDAR